MSPCTDAVIKDVFTLKPENTVREAMDIFEGHNIRSLPVVDREGNFLGIFGLRHILLKLLPKSVTMQHGLNNLDFVQGATPGVAKRLRKLFPEKVVDHMDAVPIVVDQDTALWEAVRIMALHGSPVALVDEKTKKFQGLISRQTLLYSLEKEIEKLEEEENNAA